MLGVSLFQGSIGVQRRSVHSIRLCLCHRLVPRNIGRLVVGGGLCAYVAYALHVLWHSECMLAGCMHRRMSTWPVLYIAHHFEPGLSVSSCVSLVFWGLPSQPMGHCSWTTVAPPLTA